MSAWKPAVIEVRGTKAERTGLLLHGIMGSGRNWRSFARRLAERRPDWRFLLVDLRHHAGSRGAPPPDTVPQCAADLERLGVAAAAVIGHSFGGKVALEWTRRAAAGGLCQAWVLDSPPDAGLASGAGAVIRFLATLRDVPTPATSREAVAAQLRGAGVPEDVVVWMNTNLERVSSGYGWRFDLDGISRLLIDYAQRDLRALAYTPRAGLEVHLVRGERSDRWSRESLRALEQPGPGARKHVLEGAGHWLHVDAPEALLALLEEHLP